MKRFVLLIPCLMLFILVYAQSWMNYSGNIVAPLSSKIGIGTTTPEDKLHVVGGSIRIGNEDNEPEDLANNILKFGDGNYVQIGEWENDDMLSFRATRYKFTTAKVGIGVIPQYNLDVQGKLYLRTVDRVNNWGYSYLYWPGHSLVMGSPSGQNAHVSIDLKPGGYTGTTLGSKICLFTATAPNVHEQKIEINSKGNVWFNTSGKFGIGTDNPRYTLDVTGITHVNNLITDSYVGIMTTAPLYPLDVRGAIRANEIVVDIVSGADYVFEDSYPLRSVEDLASYIGTNKHLPEIPSAQEMETNGVSVSNMQIQLLQKIEELTLYMINQEKEIQRLRSIIEGK